MPQNKWQVILRRSAFLFISGSHGGLDGRVKCWLWCHCSGLLTVLTGYQWYCLWYHARNYHQSRVRYPFYGSDESCTASWCFETVTNQKVRLIVCGNTVKNSWKQVSATESCTAEGHGVRLNEEDQSSTSVAAGRVGPRHCPAYWPLCWLSGRPGSSSIKTTVRGGLSAYQHHRLLAKTHSHFTIPHSPWSATK